MSTTSISMSSSSSFRITSSPTITAQIEIPKAVGKVEKTLTFDLHDDEIIDWDVELPLIGVDEANDVNNFRPEFDKGVFSHQLTVENLLDSVHNFVEKPMNPLEKLIAKNLIDLESVFTSDFHECEEASCSNRS